MFCCICFDDINKYHKVWECEKCHGTLHQECFEKWRKNCPYCRNEICNENGCCELICGCIFFSLTVRILDYLLKN